MLALLALTVLTTLSGLLAILCATLAICAESLQFAAEAIHVIERGGLGSVVVLAITSILARAGRLLRLMDLVVELLQTRSDLRFCAVRVGIDPLAQPICAALDQVGEVGLIHAAQRIAQAGSGAGLVGC